MMKNFLLIAMFLLAISQSNLMAQSQTDSTEFHKIADKISLGIGLGQDYGGIGANLLVYPSENIGLFGGAGYALAGVGYNVGLKYRFFSKNNPRTNFYVMGMYGYNAAVKVENGERFDKLFYGPSVGFGIDTGKRSYRKGYWTIALLVPFRNSEVDDYLDELEDDYGVKFDQKFWPIAFSIGYRFALD